MTVTFTKNADGTWTMKPDADAAAVIDWAMVYHAPEILDQVLLGWLIGETIYMQSRMGQDAIAIIKKPPQAVLDKAVDGITDPSLSDEDKAALKAAIAGLRGGG